MQYAFLPVHVSALSLSMLPKHTHGDEGVYLPPAILSLSRNEKPSAAKDTQLENLRLQHDKLLKMLKLKDLDIQHLQQAVRMRDIALTRQEELMGQTKERLIFQENSEKVQLEKKDLEIAILKAKNKQQGDKLIEQSKLLSTLHDQQQMVEQETVAYSQHVKRKVQKLRENLQFAQASLKGKDEERELQKKCIDAIKLKLWEREQMIQKMKRDGEQLQRALDKKDMICKQLQIENTKIKEENFKIEKSLAELKRQYQVESRMQVSYLQKQKDHIQKLEIALSKAESFLYAKNRELQASQTEKMRIYEEHESLKTKYNSLMHDHVLLQTRLIDLESCVNPNEKFRDDGTNYYGNQHQYGGSGCINVGKKHHGHWRYATDCLIGQKQEKYITVSNGCIQDTQPTPAIGDGPASIDLDCNKEQNDDMKFNGMISTNYTAIPKFPSVTLSAGTDCCKRDHFIESVPGSVAFDSAMETKLDQNGAVHDLHFHTSLELRDIQEEIKNRERSWKRIEARMRAELSRRVAQLQEAKDKCQPFIAEV